MGNGDDASCTASGQTQALVDDVLSRSDARKSQRVSALWSILQLMRTKGVVEFSVAAVGRECERAGFLKTQSIRNAAGRDYRAIISSYRNEVGVGFESERQMSPVRRFINSIADVQVKVRMLEMIETNRRQAVEINRLRNGYKHINLVRQAETAGVDPKGLKHDFDRKPLEKFVSANWLDTHGLEVRRSGAVFSLEGDRLTPDGFVKALRYVLSGAEIEC